MDHRITIPFAILVAGAIAGFGPRLLDSYTQSTADDSLQCATYRSMATLDSLKETMGEPVDYEATERMRVEAGCSFDG